MQDLTIVLTTSSIFGSLFEAIKQPVLNGYILAGSLVGPDGLALVKELVQVESLAQVRTTCYTAHMSCMHSLTAQTKQLLCELSMIRLVGLVAGYAAANPI